MVVVTAGAAIKWAAVAVFSSADVAIDGLVEGLKWEISPDFSRWWDVRMSARDAF